MWPWSQQPHITALLSPEEEEEEEANDRTDANDAPNNAGLFVLQAPGGGNGERRKGAYSVPADFVVDGELLEKAISQVKWLTVSFPRVVGRDESVPRWMVRAQIPYLKEGTDPVPDFPRWIFRLQHLKGLNLVSYPHKTLPEELGNLDELERFHCYGSPALNRLPRSMGRLENLIELDCYTSYQLHYLPYEISRCPKLSSSRFSTRTLYNNDKNQLPLPPLHPWWRCKEPAATQATTPDSTRQLLAQVRIPTTNHEGEEEDSSAAAAHQELFAPSFTNEHILPFLHWDLCSVCNEQYELDRGFQVWSHQRIATDSQALLAFCCSTECAAHVPHQMFFDFNHKANKKVGGKGTKLPAKFTLEQALPVWTQAMQSRRYFPDYASWAMEHLNKPYTFLANNNGGDSSISDLPIMQRLSWDGTGHEEGSNRFFRKVVAAGDIREHPRSSSKNLGRLKIGAIVLVHGPFYVEPGTRRKWAKLLFSSSPTSSTETSLDGCWTALSKKDGTMKLGPLN